MNQDRTAHFSKLFLFYLLALSFSALLCFSSCREKKKEDPNTDKNEAISWNILFKPGADQATRDELIAEIRAYVQKYYDDYNATNGTTYKPTEEVNWCPCDTLLYNYNFSSLFGSGPSLTSAPSQQRTQGSGDPIHAIVSLNSAINEPDKNLEIRDRKEDSPKQRITGIDTSKILAIIDSGLDTSLVSNTVKSLLWKDTPASSTLYNFLPGQPTSDLSDQTAGKHGSAVTAIAARAMEIAPRYSRIMILKALDKNNSGSIFSLSCALSYAIQKKATVVNASLGYYGSADSILYHYLRTGADQSPAIQVFAAAGNTSGAHTPANFCNPAFNNNELGDTLLFYPACFSVDLKNITSVTQLSKIDEACFYQNYSNKFITLGVLNKNSCCEMPANFQGNAIGNYEGSSFATPVASGLKIGTIIATGSVAPGNPLWNSLIGTDPMQKVILDGRYVVYQP